MKKISTLLALGTLLMLICQYLIYIYAPIEQTMGPTQKIFYIHLPFAWWCFVGFFISCLGSIAYLRTQKAKYDHLAYAGAELALFCATLALVTGSIWARHSWGTWWTWDPRLSTTLVLWFIFASYLIIAKLDLPKKREATVRSVIAIIGFLDVPLVFFSARIWKRTIHPDVFTSSGSSLAPEMLYTVLACVLSFGVLWTGLLLLRTKQIAYKARIEKLLTLHS